MLEVYISGKINGVSFISFHISNSLKTICDEYNTEIWPKHCFEIQVEIS